MQERESIQIVREMFDAWNAHDVQRYAKVLDATCVVETRPGNPEPQDRAAACFAMQRLIAAVPDLRFLVEALTTVGDRVVARWLAVGTPAREKLPMLEATVPLEVSGCTVATIRDGRIVHLWMYWDSAQMLRFV